MKKRLLSITVIISVLLTLAPITTSAVSSTSDIKDRIVTLLNNAPYKGASYTAFNGKGLGSGCYAFVNSISLDLFGTKIPYQKANSYGYYTELYGNDNWEQIGSSAYNNDSVIELLKRAQAGDIFQYSNANTRSYNKDTKQYKQSLHIAMIQDVTPSEVTICDNSGSSGVRTRTIEWDKLIKSVGDFNGQAGYALSLHRCLKGLKSNKTEIITKPASDITATSVKLNGALSSPYSVNITEHGAYLGLNPNDMQKVAVDKVNYKKNSLNMFYTISGKDGSKYYSMIVPGTSYYYREYAIIDGKEIQGDIKTFKTEDFSLSITPVNKQIRVISTAGTENAPSHVLPYGGSPVKSRYAVGEILTVTGNTENAYGNRWLKLTDGGWIVAKYIEEIEETSDPEAKENDVSETEKINDNFPQSSPIYIDEGTYYLHSALADNLVAGVQGASTDWEANVELENYTGSTSQAFKIELFNSTDRIYTIVNDNSQLSLDVYGASDAAGTNVQQYYYWPSETRAQQWVFEDAGDGYYFIRSALGTYLDVLSGVAADGQNIQMYTGNGTAAQKWRLEKKTSVPVPEETPTPTVKPSVTVDFIIDTEHFNIGITNATLANRVEVTGTSTEDISLYGLVLYDSYGNQLATRCDETQNISGRYSYAIFWYDLNLRLNYYLNPGTSYKFLFYVVINGEAYWSQTYSFTTESSANIRTGLVKGTNGALAINDAPAASPQKSNQIGRIPEGNYCNVYTDKSSGNWYWVEFNGVQGYAYSAYITLC